MVVGFINRIRIPPKLTANWLRKVAIQLDLFDVIRDNVVKTGANGEVTPPPPNQDGGISSTMTYTNANVLHPPVQLSLRPKYPQNWTAYNAAQSGEKARFVELLVDLCQHVPESEYSFGRPRLPVGDMVFACAYKVYSGFAARRFTSDLREACAKGLISQTPHFNSVSNYMADPDLTPILMELVTLSSTPLSAVESQFAIDSSGFSTSQFVRWFNKKYGRETDNRQWVKAHIMCGVTTNVVTSAEVTGWTAADTTYFEPLLARTAQHFRVGEVSLTKPI